MRVAYILELLKDLPFVTGAMVPIFGFGKLTARSAHIEAGFKDLKKGVFKNEQLPLRAGVFLTKHIVALEGQLKLVASEECMNRRETEVAHVDVDLTVESRPGKTNTVEINTLKGNGIT